MIDYQGERFQKKIAELNISATEAASRIEISRDTIHKWFKKDRLDHRQVVKITKGLGLSEEEIWGDDLSKSNAKPALFKGSGSANMWVVPIKAQGGFLEGYGDDIVMEQNIEKVYFPFIGSECFAFEIEGLSMLTEYVPGEYFIGTPIENFNHLVKGRSYVFQTIDGIILKEFVNIEDDYIYLRSLNEDYNPVKPIYLKEVKRVYQREMVIKN
ncbi:hypothetical protein ORI89_17565 [Sphingobacterium sp. UT-1RO-CII-1]|uniref:LexA family transcriptional regulator n=1 Tax=Sphingobacterium sp. UT-1RO-CII-1 TaxID=2995225 RepID=UPI00227B2760|nr:S24 family peptidase [Sphingobacterium sp. UT-1RO-CII-1]MCY4781468.1 hypothetical protein [Sphingobacterium sp. UT-1RO-CII-1]